MDEEVLSESEEALYERILQDHVDRLRERNDKLAAQNAELRAQIQAEEAEIARHEAKLAVRPFAVDHPYIYAFLMMTLPVWLGYFVLAGPTNRTAENIPTGLLLGIGLFLGMGTLMHFLNRKWWPKE